MVTTSQTVVRRSAYGQWIYEARNKRGMTQSKLASKATVSAMTIYNVESGKTRTLQLRTHQAVCRVLASSPEEAAAFDALREAERQHARTNGEMDPDDDEEEEVVRVNGADTRPHTQPDVAAHIRSADTYYIDQSSRTVTITYPASSAPSTPDGVRSLHTPPSARQAHAARRNTPAQPPSWGRRFPMMVLVGIASTALLAAVVLPSANVSATPPATLCRTGSAARSAVLDGWIPGSRPDPRVSGNRTAIVMHNMKTGDEKPILNPEGTSYWCYMAALWVPQLQQLFYVAVMTNNQHDIWHTPLRDNGSDVAPSTPPPGSGWPQTYLTNVGASCTALVWLSSTQTVSCSQE